MRRFVLLYCLFFVGLYLAGEAVHPSEYTLYFQAFEFELNDPAHWNKATSNVDTESSSKTCTKRFPNLCIVRAEATPGFAVKFNGESYDFSNHNDWTRVDEQYPLDFMEKEAVPSRRRALYDYLYTMYDDGYNYGDYNYGDYQYNDAYSRPFGLRNGWQRNGGLPSSMFSPGMGQYGVAPMMGMVPGLQKGFYPGMQSKQMGKMFSMLGRMMRGRALFKKRRRRKHKNYMADGGQFGKMGFPSITGNMMGLVRTQHKMPNFMKVPPTIHINADFRRRRRTRRLLEMESAAQLQGLVLTKCVVVGAEEMCALYDLGTRSIALRLIVADRYETHAHSNGNHNFRWDGPMFAAIEGERTQQEKTEVLFTRTVSWSDFSPKCNDLILSIFDYQICVKNNSSIYFQAIANPVKMAAEEEKAGTDGETMSFEYANTVLSVSNDSDWDEVYVYPENQKRYCMCMPMMKICAHVHDDKIQAISAHILSDDSA